MTPVVGQRGTGTPGAPPPPPSGFVPANPYENCKVKSIHVNKGGVVLLPHRKGMEKMEGKSEKEKEGLTVYLTLHQYLAKPSPLPWREDP